MRPERILFNSTGVVKIMFDNPDRICVHFLCGDMESRGLNGCVMGIG